MKLLSKLAVTHIYFVRHAEPNYKNHDDPSRELSEKGFVDRNLVTSFLEDKDIYVVLSSPFKRAVDTVKDFADKHHHPITTVEDFRERRVDSGWIDDFDAFTQRQWSDFSYKLQDGETLGQVQKRNVAALQRVLTDYKGKTVVIGSHGTALSTIINYYYPDFGYTEFQRIKGLMPWIVHFAFQEDRCVLIEEYDVFTKQFRRIMEK